MTRSAKNISAQIIDDKANTTLVSATSNTKSLKETKKINLIYQKLLQKTSQKKQKKKITKVYFDRSVYKYHGRIKVFADTLRKNGMEF